MSEAKKYIDGHYWQSSIGLNEIAEKTGVNPSYLSNIFKKEYGCSISRYLVIFLDELPDPYCLSRTAKP